MAEICYCFLRCLLGCLLHSKFNQYVFVTMSKLINLYNGYVGFLSKALIEVTIIFIDCLIIQMTGIQLFYTVTNCPK